MAEVVATKGITFKMDSEILDIASSVLREHGYSLSKGMTLFLKNVALTKSVDLPNEKEIDNELLFMKLKEEIAQGISEVRSGKYYTDTDLVERYGL